MSTPPPTNGPLADTLVIDLTRALAGPHAGMMLADLGARVIKVETPGTGDDSRGWGPPFVAGESTYFFGANRNKESIALDLKSDDGRRVLAELVERADVLLENFRPGVLDRLGFSFAALHERNPRLVVLSISGFGHDGPEGGRAGYDQIAQGEAGIMSLTGSGPHDPQKVGVAVGDLLAGMYGAYGVVAALHERSRTGLGQHVRTSLLAALVGVHAFQGTRWTIGHDLPLAQGNHHPSIAPYGLFRCGTGSDSTTDGSTDTVDSTGSDGTTDGSADTVDSTGGAGGAVQIALGSEALWVRFCETFGLDPAADGFATNAERVSHRPETIALVEGVFAEYGAAELLALLAEAGIPAGKVRTLDEVYAWDQTRSQGLVVSVDHPTAGEVELPGPPLRFFAADGAEVTRRDHEPPPLLDEDGAAIRAWLRLE